MAQSDPTQQRVVYRLPGMDDAIVRRDLEFAGSDGDTLTLDLYRPLGSREDVPLPLVLFVSGYPDPGMQAIMGCRLKEMEAYVSWGRLAAASGLAAIAYSNREPTADLEALLQHLRSNASNLGIDARRIGIWAASGNVPNALSLLMSEHDLGLRCAVLCYGYMLDLAGSTGVADAAKAFGFVNPNAGKSAADLRRDLPLFVARAGGDAMPQLNAGIDAFLAEAVRLDLPLTFVNHAAAPHAFDLSDDREATHRVIRQILGFLRDHLLSQS